MRTNRVRRVGPVAYVRTVRTASEPTAVQIVHSSRRGARRGARGIQHLGAHDGVDLESLKAAVRQRLAHGQGELDLSVGCASGSGPLEITSSRMGAYVGRAVPRLPGARPAGGRQRDEVFGPDAHGAH